MFQSLFLWSLPGTWNYADFSFNPCLTLFIDHHSGPSTLSFDKDDFAHADFQVDEFIAKHRRAGIPLETLKEDLSLYLEVLETAMYDLINRDYQDFVSLSSNLVGLDTALEDLSNPLNILKQDVSSIQNKMRETLQVGKNNTFALSFLTTRSVFSLCHCF